MTKTIRIGVALLSLFGVTGCARAVEGMSLSAPRCSVYAYEDLSPSNLRCDEVKGAPQTESWGVRYEEVNGQRVTYLIPLRHRSSQASDALSDETVEVRSYLHEVVYIVQRESAEDKVTIYASDNCGVGKYAKDPYSDLGCGSISIAYRSIDSVQARQVLPQAAVDKLELLAFNSGRTATYTLAVITSLSPASGAWTNRNSTNRAWLVQALFISCAGQFYRGRV